MVCIADLADLVDLVVCNADLMSRIVDLVVVGVAAGMGLGGVVELLVSAKFATNFELG